MKYVNQNINKKLDWCLYSEIRVRRGGGRAGCCCCMRNIPFRGYVHYSDTSKNRAWTLTDESFNSLKFVLFWAAKTRRSHYCGE